MESDKMERSFFRILCAICPSELVQEWPRKCKCLEINFGGNWVPFCYLVVTPWNVCAPTSWGNIMFHWQQQGVAITIALWVFAVLPAHGSGMKVHPQNTKRTECVKGENVLPPITTLLTIVPFLRVRVTCRSTRTGLQVVWILGGPTVRCPDVNDKEQMQGGGESCCSVLPNKKLKKLTTPRTANEKEAQHSNLDDMHWQNQNSG